MRSTSVLTAKPASLQNRDSFLLYKQCIGASFEELLPWASIGVRGGEREREGGKKERKKERKEEQIGI
jgi:hypothetical protein